MRTKKTKRIVVGLVVAVIVVSLGFAVFRAKSPPDRIYKGKRVSQWVAACVEKPQHTFGKQNNPEFDAVREIGPEAVPHLIEAIRSSHGIRGNKYYAGIYTNLPGSLRRALPEPKDVQLIRTRSYWTLAALGPVARPAVPFLVEQFNTNWYLLSWVTYTLSELGPDAREAIPALTRALQGPEGPLKWHAGMILARIDPENKELMPTILAELKSSNVVSRRFASIALRDLGPAAKPALPALTEALNDGDPTVRARAGEALDKMRQPTTNENK